MKDQQIPDSDVRHRIDMMLHRMREGVIRCHEREAPGVTTSLIFSCARSLGPLVDPSVGMSSKQRIEAFFTKYMAGFNREVRAEDRRRIIEELHQGFERGFEGYCFPRGETYAYVEPESWLADGTASPAVINLDLLVPDFLAAVEDLRHEVFVQSDVLERFRQRLEKSGSHEHPEFAQATFDDVIPGLPARGSIR